MASLQRSQRDPVEDEMNTKQTHQSATDTKRDLSREASGKHQGVRQPGDDQRVEQALDDAGLDDLGASVEDEIRGRRGSGVAPADDVRSDGNDDERNERR
jgi:hypothetical protein